MSVVLSFISSFQQNCQNQVVSTSRRATRLVEESEAHVVVLLLRLLLLLLLLGGSLSSSRRSSSTSSSCGGSSSTAATFDVPLKLSQWDNYHIKAMNSIKVGPLLQYYRFVKIPMLASLGRPAAISSSVDLPLQAATTLRQEIFDKFQVA